MLGMLGGDRWHGRAKHILRPNQLLLLSCP